MRVLAITYCFVPILMPATMRLLKWFTGLEEQGISATVLAIDPDSFKGPKDETLARLVPGNVEVLRVWSPENNLLHRFLRKKYTLFYKLFEPRKMEWYRPAVKALNGLDPKQFDIIFSCSQPHSCHLLGSYLKEKTGKPWVAYFSDPWTDNPFSEYKTRKIFEYNARLEHETMTKADFIFFTSQETLDLILKKYPTNLRAKCDVLSHCFIPEWYSLAPVAEATPENGCIRLLQTGNFYGPRSPMPFLKALHRLHKERNLAGKLEVQSFGRYEPKYEAFIKENNLVSLVSLGNTIPYLDSLARMRQADYLLLVDSPLRNSAESVFLPSKLIDYMGSGVPILGITPLKGTSARVLRETGNIVCDVDDESAIYEVLCGIVDGTRKINPNRERVQQFHYKAVTSQLANVLRHGTEKAV